jgi:hypothetical protein
MHIRKQLSGALPLQNSLKQDDLSSLLSNFALQNVIRKVQDNCEGLEMNGKHGLLPPSG